MIRPARSLLLVALGAGFLMAQMPSAQEAQRVLDTIAAPFAPSLSIAGLPDSYTAWTVQQRRQMNWRCVTLWPMFNDSGHVKLLPPAQDPADTPRLVTDLCLLAHMPNDWPSRMVTLRDAQRILDRSTALGERLTLPPALQNTPAKHD
jgi:hypothetical protein